MSTLGSSASAQTISEASHSLVAATGAGAGAAGAAGGSGSTARLIRSTAPGGLNQRGWDSNQLRPGGPSREWFGRHHRSWLRGHRPFREDTDHEADLVEDGAEQRDQGRRRELHEVGSGEEMSVRDVVDRPQPVRGADKRDAAVIERLRNPSDEGEWIDNVFEDLGARNQVI